jgi:hypothetical protein
MPMMIKYRQPGRKTPSRTLIRPAIATVRDRMPILVFIAYMIS